MPSRSSPPTKQRKHANSRNQPSFLRRRSRWLYSLLALVALYFWYTSNLHLLPARHPVHAPSLRYKNIDWSHYAYSQYATNSAYLCSAVMVFEALSRFGSKADRILFYPQEWDLQIASSTDRDSQLLVKAREYYGVKLLPIEIPTTDDDAWNSSFTKFHAWGQTQYERIIYLDSDVTVQDHLDELFIMPRAPVAMTRQYWMLPNVRKLTSLLIVLEPSESEYQRLMYAARAEIRQKGEYDMEILNRFYGDSAMVLSHQQYGLLSGEFRISDHENYVGNSFDKWDPERVLREASLVHFSDWPLPKPWVMWPHNLVAELKPHCRGGFDGEALDCRDKTIWMGLYDDFRKRRKDVCALLSEPAPEWPPRNDTNS